MNTKTALQGTVTATGPLVLAAGTAMLTVAVASSAIGGSQGQAALPRQTVTVTPPAAAPSSAAGTIRSSPSPDPSGQVLAAESTQTERIGRASRVGRGTDGTGQDESSPPADPPPAEERCPSGRVLTVRLPVGALPCDTVVIGGNR